MVPDNKERIMITLTHDTVAGLRAMARKLGCTASNVVEMMYTTIATAPTEAHEEAFRSFFFSIAQDVENDSTIVL